MGSENGKRRGIGGGGDGDVVFVLFSNFLLCVCVCDDMKKEDLEGAKNLRSK